MKRLITLLLTTILMLPSFAHAEIKTITHTVQQPFGGSQSPDDARTAGIARAKREALERFGSYIESTTVVKNSQVDSDEILALTAGVTKAEVVKQKNYTEGDAFGLEITVKVELDTAVLDQSLKRLLQDRNHLKDLTSARQREKQLLARIAELEKENTKKGNTPKQKEELKKEFQETRDGLSAVEWFDKAVALWDGKKQKFPDSKKAIEYLSQAIRLDPNDALAYINRGIAYRNLKQYQQAINDYDQATRLDPSDADAYYNRGITYSHLKQYQHAIKDYDQAIQFDPGNAKAYNNRGVAYKDLKQYQQAINDYDQAIRLDPGEASAYYNRGIAYGRYLMQYQQAISDFTQAIRLAPGDAEAYNNRGIAYLASGFTEKGCQDLQNACSLGACGGLNFARQKGECQ
jgi:tetratricopeptide (TPR) repeat protein